MLSLEVEEDLGLGSKKVETLDTFNPVFLWLQLNFVLEILGILRIYNYLY